MPPGDIAISTVLVDAIIYAQQRNDLTRSGQKRLSNYIRAMFVPEKEGNNVLDSSHGQVGCNRGSFTDFDARFTFGTSFGGTERALGTLTSGDLLL